jgi:hypothetical protein
MRTFFALPTLLIATDFIPKRQKYGSLRDALARQRAALAKRL